MSISGIGQNHGAAGVSGVTADVFQYLTPESLLLYCKSQLQSLDSDINEFMDQQKRAHTTQKLLSELESAMKKLLQGGNWDDVSREFDNAINSLPPGDSLRAKLESQKDQIWADYEVGGKYGRGPTADEWKIRTEDVHLLFEDIKGNAELEMIQLQSLVSQRQTAIQLTTSILSKHDQGVQSILKNI